MELAERLFELPRIEIDLATPNALRLNFSGTVELDRTNVEDVDFFNALKPGNDATVNITVRIDGGGKVHKRDDSGEVVEIIETKRLVATEVYVGGVD